MNCRTNTAEKAVVLRFASSFRLSVVRRGDLAQTDLAQTILSTNLRMHLSSPGACGVVALHMFGVRS